MSGRPCGPAPHQRTMVVSKLSKLLNQEDALSAPWLKHFRNFLKTRCSWFLSKLLLSPLFYQDGQIFVFSRPPKLIRSAEA